MILGFKEQFVEKIFDGSKIHTIREDKADRWMMGRPIHFATGVGTKKYKEFKKGECISIQDISINPYTKSIIIMSCYKFPNNHLDVKEILRFIKNDGFDTVEDFWRFFDKHFEGVIIHWTDFKY